ncbi:hypothetical protein B0H13DRAFT_1897081 [Mycena leptocephala]|nr:hypothetical protein B0H13DRAFT_1897081 [Mycena leptocephala]
MTQNVEPEETPRQIKPNTSNVQGGRKSGVSGGDAKMDNHHWWRESMARASDWFLDCSGPVVKTIKQNKNICTELLEQTYKLLNAVLMVHVKSDTGGELPPNITEMKEDAENRHQAVLNMIEGLSDTTSSDGASLVSDSGFLKHCGVNRVSWQLLRNFVAAHRLQCEEQKGQPRLPGLDPFFNLEALGTKCSTTNFIDIADNTHNPDEVDKILFVTDNMPLAINLWLI